MCGAGTEIRFGDAYRGIQPAGKDVFRSVLNIEAAWSAKILGFDVSEMVIVKDIEVGPYMDFAWFGPSATIVPRPGAIVTGLVASATASFVGLAPLDVSAFAGFDFSGSAVIGISAGRLFKSGGSNAAGLPSAHRVDGSSDQSLKRTPIVENP